MRALGSHSTSGSCRRGSPNIESHMQLGPPEHSTKFQEPPKTLSITSPKTMQLQLSLASNVANPCKTLAINMPTLEKPPLHLQDLRREDPSLRTLQQTLQSPYRRSFLLLRHRKQSPRARAPWSSARWCLSARRPFLRRDSLLIPESNPYYGTLMEPF